MLEPDPDPAPSQPIPKPRTCLTPQTTQPTPKPRTSGLRQDIIDARRGLNPTQTNPPQTNFPPVQQQLAPKPPPVPQTVTDPQSQLRSTVNQAPSPA